MVDPIANANASVTGNIVTNNTGKITAAVLAAVLLNIIGVFAYYTPLSFTASNGAVVAANVTDRFAHVINVVDDFGAKGDGVTDDWAAIQKAEGMNTSGLCTYTQPTLVVVPPTTANTYRVSQAIRRCPWVTLQVQSNATTFKCDGSATGTDFTGAISTNQFPANGCLLSGNVGAGNNLPTLALAGALAVGAQSVTLTTLADASKLAVGDLVIIETTASYSYGGAEAVNLKMALVTAINSGTGVISLDRAMDFASSSAQIRKLSNGAGTAGWPISSPQHLVFYASHHSSVIGGRWLTTSATPWYQPFDPGGGCLDCVTAPDEVTAAYGVGYGNLFQDSSFSVRREEIYNAAFEHAYHSSGNDTRIGVIHSVGAPSSIPQPIWTISYNEGSHDNRIVVARIEDYNGDVSPTWLFGGTVTTGGGDATSTTLYTPAVISASVNAAGAGYTVSAVGGTMTWSGSGCTTNPVLSVSTTAGGAIGAVTSVITPGICSTLPSSAATTWTVGGGIAGGTGATFTLTGKASVTIAYTTVNGDTLSTVASAVAALFNANSTFATQGFSATANQANGGPGSIIFANPTGGVPFTLMGSGANALTAYSRLHDVVLISDAFNNRVDIGSITGAAITGYPVEINGGTATNESPTTDNEVTISQSSLTYQNGDVAITGAGATRNSVHDGWFHGPTFQPKAFWIQSNAGGQNKIAHVKSDDPSGYPWCDTNDYSNELSDIFAPLSIPRTQTSNYGLAQFSAFCNVQRVTSNAVNAFLALGGDFTKGNVTSGGGTQFAFAPAAAGAPEIGDSFHIRAHLNLSGTAGPKTGTFAYWCTNPSWSIPADATGMAEIDYDCAHWGQNSTACTMRILSNSATATPPSTTYSSCAFGQLLGGSMTFNATSASDILQPEIITFIPYAPTYSGRALRP